VIVLDSRRHGPQNPTAAPIAMTAMAADVLALMDTRISQGGAGLAGVTARSSGWTSPSIIPIA